MPAIDEGSGGGDPTISIEVVSEGSASDGAGEVDRTGSNSASRELMGRMTAKESAKRPEKSVFNNRHK